MKLKIFSHSGRDVVFYLSMLLASSIIIIYASKFVSILFNLKGWGLRPPSWDQAVHALDAIHFAKAFQELDPIQFLVQIQNSALWPPVVPLLQSIYLLFTDLSIASVRNSIAFCTIISTLAIFYSGWKLDKTWGFAVGLLASAILLVSPEFQEFSLQVMLEVPGIALTLITFFLYCHYLDERNPKYWRRTVISATVLFFAKFNYAIMIFLPILCNEWLLRPEMRQSIYDALSYLRHRIRWWHPFAIFVYIYLCFLIYVHFVGIRFELLGRIVLIRRAWGNPLYLLIFITMIRMLIFQRQEWRLYLNHLWNAPGLWRPVVRLFLLPVAIWMSYPPFFSTFFIFLFSESTRKQTFFSTETLRFYPGAFVENYSANYGIAAAIIIGVVISFLSWRVLSPKIRFLIGIVVFNLILVLSHPNYQKRYLLTTAPFIFLLGTFGLTLPLQLLLKRRLTIATVVSRVGSITAFLVIVGYIGFDPQALQERFVKQTLSPTFRTLSEKICLHTYRAQNNAIIGLTGFLNPAAIAMTCYQQHPDIKRSQLPTTMTRLGFHGYQDGAKVVSTGKIDQFFVADYSKVKRSVGRQQEAFLLPGARSSLPKLNLYRLVDFIVDPDSHLELSVYKRLSKPSRITRKP